MPVVFFGQKETIANTEIDSLFELKEYDKIINVLSERKNYSTKKINPQLYQILAKSFERLNKEDSAFYYYRKALSGFDEIKNERAVANINLEIFLLLDSQENGTYNGEKYFQKFYDYAVKSNSKNLLAAAYRSLGIKYFGNKNHNITKQYFLKALDIYREIDSLESQVKMLSNLSVLYNAKLKERDSAKQFLYNAIKIADQNSFARGDEYFLLYNNLGNIFRGEKNNDSALYYFRKANKEVVLNYELNNKKIIYKNLEDVFNKMKMHDSAYHYLKLKDSIVSLIEISKQNTSISEIQEKYDNEKLRGDNLELDVKNSRNQILLYISIAIISFGLIIFYLIHKNTKRKQYIAEQQREIEKQKTEKILKEQEITSINAMIEGQEKERQRVASDLHDSVGATLAAAKLQFQHIAKNKSKAAEMGELFEKTEKLLTDAYTEVRSMAHVKNSGVIAKKGLLPAIKKLAENVSVSGNLMVEVQDFGLNERLENSLEITIFRIIQELITNIVKHANASFASINITQHEALLSIIVEDNGKGFKISEKLTNQNGMGLSSIEKRIEHLEGTLEVDSSPGKGTTILIDLPL